MDQIYRRACRGNSQRHADNRRQNQVSTTRYGYLSVITRILAPWTSPSIASPTIRDRATNAPAARHPKPDPVRQRTGRGPAATSIASTVALIVRLHFDGVRSRRAVRQLALNADDGACANTVEGREA